MSSNLVINLTASLVGLSVIGVIGLLTNYKEEDSQNTIDRSIAPFSTDPMTKTESVVESSINISEATPLPTNSPSPSSVNSDKPTDNDQEVSIEFINLPQQVKSGEKFKVKWKVNGPPGTVAEETTLEASYMTNNSSENSSASTSSESSQSHGSFETPKTFDSNFSFGSDPGTVDLQITAEIDDQVITKESTVRLVK